VPFIFPSFAVLSSEAVCQLQFIKTIISLKIWLPLQPALLSAYFQVPTEFQIAAVHLKSIACEDICGHQFTT
jgi:hypothetical protein